MSELRFTPEQQAAITDREGPLLLSANAGSGKTSVLVERLVRAILDDGLAPGQLLAITFTDKAAGELRSRVRERLAALGARAAARDIERAQISTIHGFCSSVLRAHPIAAGLDPDFTVLPVSTTRGLRERAFATALADLLADPAQTDALDLVAAWGPDRLADAIADAHDTLRSQGQTRPRLPSCAPRHTVAAAVAGLRDASEAFSAELRGVRGGVQTIEAARARLSDCHAALADGAEPTRELLAGLKISRSAAELKTDTCAAWVAAVAAAGEALDDREAAGAHAVLDELLIGFAEAYAQAKRTVSGVDYDDLQLLARDLFAGQPAVAAAYAERFARIMVDEFQDTNRLQLELIAHLDRGHSFLVGDELQSIYGFRHAEVALFREQRARHRAQGRSAVLATNWRSHPELLATINGAWGAAVHEGYEPLVAGRPATAPAGAPRTELLLVGEGWDDDGLDARLADELAAGLPGGVKASKLAEARAVARRVRALVDGGACVEADVAVLARAATDLHVYERALGKEGFATLAGGGRGYWLRQPVQDLTSYLGALVNPRDERALYGTLASPLCGLSSDGLAHVAAVAREQGHQAWRAVRSVTLAQRLSGPDAARLEAFLMRFTLERTSASRYGLDELIERAVTRSGYDLHVLRLPGGRRRLANVHKLERLAAAYEAEHGRDVRGFIDHAQAEAEADVREADAPVELGGESAVRLMTIHAAKGLEFGVVIVADLGRRGRAEAGDLLVDGDRVGLRLLRLAAPGVPALAHRALVEQANAAAAVEERRIYHVAFTRARERLILAGTVPAGDAWPATGTTASPLSWMGPALDEALPARLLDEPELTLEHDAGHGPVRVTARLVVPETAPGTLGLAAPPPPGAQLGLFGVQGGANGSPEIAARADADARAQAARLAVPGNGDDRADPAVGRLLEAGLAGALTDPDSGLDEPGAATAPAPAAAPVATLSYSSLSAHARCGYRFYLERVLRLPPTDGPLPAPAAGLDPLARGAIVHHLLERLDLRRPQLPGVAEVQALGPRYEVEPTAAEATELLGLVATFVTQAPLLDRLRAARRVRVESGFVLAHPDPGLPLLTGFVDVLAEEPDGTTLVVDYKSDRLDGADPVTAMGEGYVLQQAVYALAALATGAPEVEVAHAFLERPAEPAVARFTPADAPALWTRVQARAAPLLARSFPVSDRPGAELCAGCPGRGGLCSHPLEATDRPRGAV